MINLNKCTWLKQAYEYIQAHPGCSKAQVIRGVGGIRGSRSYAYRNSSINRLLTEKLVVDRGRRGAYSLYAA